MSMTATATVVDQTNRRIIVDGTIALAGSYATDGVTLDLSPFAPSNAPLARFEAWSTVTGGSAMLFDAYNYTPGNGLTDGKLQIGVAGAEMAATAFATTSPTNAAGFVLRFRAEFLKAQ